MKKLMIALVGFTTIIMAQESAIKASLARYAKGQPNLSDFVAGGPIEVAVNKMELGTNFRMKYVAAQWLLAAQTLRFQNPSLGAGNPQAIFDRAWVLGWSAYLEATGVASRTLSGAEQPRVAESRQGGSTTVTRTLENSEALSVIDLDKNFVISMRNLNLQIAVGMENWNRANEALMAMENELTLPGVDLQSAFIAAAHTGRAKTLVAVASTVPQAALESFHTRALGSPNDVDYAALVKMAQKDPTNIVSVGLPSYQSFPVVQYRVRLLEASGSNSERVAAAQKILSAWQTQGPDAFTTSPFQRIGAVAHWYKPGKINTPMTGFWNNNTIIMMGYVNNTDGSKKLEDWTITRSANPNIWTGKLRQETVSASGEKMVLTLETELELRGQ